MIEKSGLTISRDIEDVKAQVTRELETIRDLMNTFEYRNTLPGWQMPFQMHRLRRALRIHYLALKIRDSTPVSPSMRELVWDLEKDQDIF